MGRSVPDTTDSLTLLGKRVLVVEDEPFIAFDIADTIEKEGGACGGTGHVHPRCPAHPLARRG